MLPSHGQSGHNEFARLSAAVQRRADTLDYIRQLLGELRSMAQAEREPIVAYFIEMAYIEASDLLREKYAVERFSGAQA